ncbi:MAG: DNA polymerase III [Treponema sp.]|nr:DNA polymerase III [Treponema sp.]
MYDNLLYQSASQLLSEDLKKDKLPGALLFSGPDSQGKLTAALETARILSCRGQKLGSWKCTCSSCMQHKALVSTNTMLLGPRDCCLEIAASRNTFINAVCNDFHVEPSRYLFIRSVRKLTMRFNGLLWQDDKDFTKVSALVTEIDELLEIIDPPHPVPSYQELTEVTKNIYELCVKLEKSYMYDSIPISQIRNLSSWAHIQAAEGKKVIIIEKAERMQENVRNALLKILEEPPENLIFILATSQRGAVMQTILSRVRTYNFYPRTAEQSANIIDRVYHVQYDRSIDSYLQTFLPVTPDQLKQYANDFYSAIVHGSIPDTAELINNCGKFEPRILLKLFLNELTFIGRKGFSSGAGTKAAGLCLEKIRDTWSSITIYNQSVENAFSTLVKELALINRANDNILQVTYDRV